MGDWTPKGQPFRELGLRVISSIVLIPIALWTVWQGGLALAAGIAIVGYAMMWEWGRMTGLTHGHVMAALIAVGILTFALPVAWLPAACFAVAAAFAFFVQPGGLVRRLTGGFGVLYVAAMLTGFWILREGPWDGRAVALYFMVFVWASDIAAYFVGRGVGGPRLSPKDSPNKTWSGATGALIACMLCGLAVSNIENMPFQPWVLTGFAISLVAQSGDMFESSLKRRFKVKDSSQLVPGHGGVLDRVDGLGAVAFVFALALFLLPQWTRVLGLSAVAQ